MASRRDLITYFGFNSGELGPGMVNRQDQARYAYGLKRMRNFIPMLQGPARKRPGIRFVCEAKDSSERVWLTPFVFSQRDAWVLVFGDETVRFITDRGQVTESAETIAALTNADPGVFTKTTHGLSVGNTLYIASLPGTSGIAGRFWRVATAPDADTFTLEDFYANALDTTASGTYTGSGTYQRVYTLDSPFGIGDITDDNNCCLLSFAQSGDVLDICVPESRSQQLTRSASTSWAFADFEPKGGPFESVDPDQTITVYAGAATGNTTLTASSGIFQSGHVGCLFLLEKKLTDTVTAWEVGKTISAGAVRRSQGHYYEALNSATTGTITPSHTEGARYDGDAGVQWQYLHSGYGWGKITAVNSATSADFTVLSRIPSQAVGNTNATTRWAFGSWNDVDGWPTHVTYFRERKTFARDTRIWGSVPADFNSFAQRDAGVVAADSAYDIDIRSGVNDAIQWIVPLADLLVGTEGGEFSVGEISSADPLGPDNVAALVGPGYGSRWVTPCAVNDAVMYALPSGCVVRELRFTFETDGYSALNRTAFSEHIAKGQIIQFAYQREAESIVWAACNNGDLLSMSYEREHDLVAWAKQALAGSFGATANAVAESIAVIPSPDGTRDELYVAAKLTINGETKRYIGYLEEHWDPDEDAFSDQFYVDWGLTYEGPATSIISGLDHLEGQTVSVFGGDETRGYRDLGDFVVANGSIDLGDASVTKAHVGLSYTATLESMNMIRPGILARIVDVYVRFIGTVTAAWQSVTQRELSWETNPATPRQMQFGNVSVNAAAAPVSRLVKVKGESGHGRELRFIITHNRPTYCNVAGVIPDLVQQGKDA